MKHLDQLLQHYHQHLVKTLETFNCNIEAFGYDKLMEEIKEESSFEFGHAVQFGVFVVHGNKGGSEVKEIPSSRALFECVTDQARNKLYFMISECNKRGWM